VNYATSLGFKSDQIIRGVYSYDGNVFYSRAESKRQNQFCFVGRKVPVKGLDLLISAYELYRSWCAERMMPAWDLIIAGPGKVTSTLPIGIRELEYLDPAKAASLMSASRCFVLPSYFEPFGVVLTEAAASGCLLSASSAVGAADDLIKEDLNGLVFNEDSPINLATALLRITLFSPQKSEEGSIESIHRAQLFTTELWSRKLLKAYELHREHVHY
jgi:glycosyltransferase involved in cell wall biosynthesis